MNDVTRELLAVAEAFMRLWADGFDDEESHEALARRAEAAIAKAHRDDT